MVQSFPVTVIDIQGHVTGCVSNAADERALIIVDRVAEAGDRRARRASLPARIGWFGCPLYRDVVFESRVLLVPGVESVLEPQPVRIVLGDRTGPVVVPINGTVIDEIIPLAVPPCVSTVKPGVVQVIGGVIVLIVKRFGEPVGYIVPGITWDTAYPEFRVQIEPVVTFLPPVVVSIVIESLVEITPV